MLLSRVYDYTNLFLFSFFFLMHIEKVKFRLCPTIDEAKWQIWASSKDEKCFLPREISLRLPFRDEACFEYLYRKEYRDERCRLKFLRTMTRLFRELWSSLMIPETWIVFHTCKFLLPRARFFKPCLSRFASGTSCCDKMCLRRGNSSSTITLHTNISPFFLIVTFYLLGSKLFICR